VEDEEDAWDDAALRNAMEELLEVGWLLLGGGGVRS